MVTIHKFPLAITAEQTINIPEGSQILSVQCQNDQLCLWAAVNTDRNKEPVTVEIFGTGNPIKPLLFGTQREFIGTVQQRNGQLVWHVFIIKP